MLKNNGTTTVVLKSPQDTTLSIGRIAIDNNITLPPKNVAGYEAFHFWKGLDGRDSYIETVLENLDFTSEAFQEYQSSISRVMFQGEVDLSDQRQFDQLMEEMFAYISGDIHEGTNEAALRPMFRDFDAVREAWEKLVEKNRGGTTRSGYSLKEDGKDGREGTKQTAEGSSRENYAGRAQGSRENNAEVGGAGILPSVRMLSRGEKSGLRLGRFTEVSQSLSKEEEGALLRYKSGESYQINAKLRDGVSLTDTEQKMVEALDHALEKLPAHEGTVYRRLSFDMEGREALDAFLAAHEAETVVRSAAYTSRSTAIDGYPVSSE